MSDDHLKKIGALIRSPFTEKNFADAITALHAGVQYLSRFDGSHVTQPMDAAILESCHMQRDLVQSVIERLIDIADPVWPDWYLK